MNLPPTVKYTLGRVGLFVAVFAALLLVPGISLLVKLMIAILASAGLQFVVLKKWRAEMIDYIDGAVSRSKMENAKLRAALAGEETPGGDAARDEAPGGDAARDEVPGGDAAGRRTQSGATGGDAPGAGVATDELPGSDLVGGADDPAGSPSEDAASTRRSADPVTGRRSRR